MTVLLGLGANVTMDSRLRGNDGSLMRLRVISAIPPRAHLRHPGTRGATALVIPERAERVSGIHDHQRWQWRDDGFPPARE